MTAQNSNRLLGLLAAIGALLGLIGLPLALLVVWGSPIPSNIPSFDEVARALSRPDDGSLFITILGYVAWIGWAVFAYGFVVELLATIRGTTVKAVHAMSPRGAARGLIASMALLISPVAPMAASAIEIAPVTVSERVDQMAAERKHSPARSTANEQDRHEQLRNATHNSTAAAASSHFTQYQVQQGDNLWEIAEDQLDDGDRFDEIYRASQGVTQPDGKHLTDPDHIEPGWELQVPISETAISPAAPKPSVPTPPPNSDRAAPETSESESPAHRPAPPPETQIAPTATPSLATAVASGSALEMQLAQPAPTGRASVDVITSSEQTPPTEDGASGLRTAGSIGALLAAGVTAALASRRIIQRRRRHPGQLIPLFPSDPLFPDGDLEPEQAMNQIADPLSMRTVDLALRALSRDCAAAGLPLPTIRLAKLNEYQFDLHLAESTQLPAPWVGTSDATVWTLSADSVTDDEGSSVDIPAPYPALVTIGHVTTQGDEAHLLIDLDHVAALGVLGDNLVVSEIIKALSLELATSVWADDLQITSIAVMADLEAALQTGRVNYVASPQPYLDQLATRSQSDSQALAAADLDLLSARSGSQLPGVWSPEVVIAAHPLVGEERSRLGRSLTRQPRTAVSAITAQDSLGEWYLELDDQDPSVGVLQPLGLRVEPQRVSAEVYEGILATFRQANQAPTSTGSEAAASPEPSLDSLPKNTEANHEDGSAFLDLTDEPGSQPPISISDSANDPRLATDGTTPPLIQILGRPEIANASGPIEATKRARCLEIAAYLAIHNEPDPHDFAAALWPADIAGEYQNVRGALMSRTRRWLATDEAGEFWLQYQANGSYRLRPDVTTDWALLIESIPDGPFAASDEELLAAIRLVRGQPFEDVPANRYGWATTLTAEMLPLLTDIAYELSTRFLRLDRWSDAAAVAEVGLRIDGLYEPLWRLRIMATHQAGDTDRSVAMGRELEQTLHRYDLDPEKETTDLITALRATANDSSPIA